MPGLSRTPLITVSGQGSVSVLTSRARPDRDCILITLSDHSMFVVHLFGGVRRGLRSPKAGVFLSEGFTAVTSVLVGLDANGWIKSANQHIEQSFLTQFTVNTREAFRACREKCTTDKSPVWLSTSRRGDDARALLGANSRDHLT